MKAVTRLLVRVKVTAKNLKARRGKQGKKKKKLFV
jgi:hypothetical protein